MAVVDTLEKYNFTFLATVININSKRKVKQAYVGDSHHQNYFL